MKRISLVQLKPDHKGTVAEISGGINLPYLLAQKLYFRIKGFLVEAVPVVLMGVALINILIYLNWLNMISGILAPIVYGLFGLPKEAIVALVIGFLRKDVAVGMPMPLGLSGKQLFIAATLLAMSFPCIATFMVIWKELGLKDLIKATAIMIIISIIVGSLLNFVILR